MNNSIGKEVIFTSNCCFTINLTSEQGYAKVALSRETPFKTKPLAEYLTLEVEKRKIRLSVDPYAKERSPGL